LTLQTVSQAGQRLSRLTISHRQKINKTSPTTLKKHLIGQTTLSTVDSDEKQNNTAANIKFALCGLTF